jgi:hypothetical protein
LTVERFARLCEELADAADEAERLARLRAYLRDVDADEASAAAWLLGGNRPPRAISRAQLRDVALRASGLPRWLFDAGHREAGNLVETIALVLPVARLPSSPSLAWWLRERVLPLSRLAPDEVAARIVADWRALDVPARIVHTHLVAGTFRSPVTALLVARALASLAGGDPIGVPEATAPSQPVAANAVGDASHCIAAVLVYAERATPKGYRLGKYTFAVWDERDGNRRLTPVAKLDIDADDERAALEAIVRRTTSERFGPVRGVTPTLVCEIAFDAIERSSRHKSGLALRAPRFVRRLPEHAVDDADTLASLRAVLESGPGTT